MPSSLSTLSFRKPAARYPADPRVVFILALSAFSGLTALILEAAPASLEAVAPRWAVFIWGLMLIVGSVATLAGMLVQNVNGVITEQIGSVMIAATTLFYSAVVFYTLGPNALSSVGIIMAWGMACGLRWFQLQALLVTAYHNQVKANIERTVIERFKNDEL